LASPPDITKFFSQKLTASDTATPSNPTAPKTSQTTNPADSAADLIGWIASHDGLWSFFALLITISGGILAFMKFILPRRRKPETESDTRDAKQRYLDYPITFFCHSLSSKISDIVHRVVPRAPPAYWMTMSFRVTTAWPASSR
jgi:hypothetical protein